SVSEPLSRLKPGGSGRDHRPLDAALAAWATRQRSRASTDDPSSRRPTLTLADRRPTKGGRQAPATRQVGCEWPARTPAARVGPPPGQAACACPAWSRDVSGSTKRARYAERRSGCALVPQGQTCQRSERAFFWIRPHVHVWESRARQALIKTTVPPALTARRD